MKMETELMAQDPLVPSVLPVRSFAFQPSFDTPSHDELRPFGLTRVKVVPARNLQPLREAVYDTQQQIAVTDNGRPLIESHRRNESYSPTDTRNDHQWEVDQVVDD